MSKSLAKQKTICSFLLFLSAFIMSSRLLAKPSGWLFEPIEISRHPSPTDWKNFINLEFAELEKFWAHHEKHGKALSAWSWQWRIAWVRVCTMKNESFCRSILKTALFDKAMVVRAEAAQQLGERYQNTRNLTVLDLLEEAFRDKRNQRKATALFVQFRILFAINQIGGDRAIALGERLTMIDPEMANYWSRLAKL